MEKLKKYGWNILVSVDQFINTILAGDPDETMSSRFGKWLELPHDDWRWRLSYPICVVLHLLDREHCVKHIEEDEGEDAVVRGTKKPAGFTKKKKVLKKRS